MLSQKIAQPFKQKYVNFSQIYQENKRRLNEVQSNISLRKSLFDETYIKWQLLETRYFYADIVPIFGHVIQEIQSAMNSENQNNQQKAPVSMINLNFVLAVYHMYIKQFKVYKEQTYRIIQNFFDNFSPDEGFKIQENLQIFVYLRKFIESETVLGNGPQIYNLTKKYSHFLEKYYLNQSNLLNSTPKTNQKFSVYLIKRAKLLENYLLSYPDLWVSTFDQSSNETSNLQEPIQKAYRIFLSEFTIFFKAAIDHWIDLDSSSKLPNPLPTNFSFRKFLLDEFTSENMNQCFNSLRLVIHRFWSILEIPKLIVERSQLLTKREAQNQEKLKFLIKKYELKNLNVLGYLTNQKMAQGSEVKFMRLLILMKNLFGYHTLRRIRDVDLTNHLDKLFSENRNAIILSKNQNQKREINILMGELISRLVSGSWTDEEDILGKYFFKDTISPNSNKERRDSKSELFSD